MSNSKIFYAALMIIGFHASSWSQVADNWCALDTLNSGVKGDDLTRFKQSPECLKKMSESDIENARFNECIRQAGLSGVHQGKCNSKTRNYLVDLSKKEPRVLVLDMQDKPLYQISYPQAPSKR